MRARGEVRGGLFGREMVHPRMVNADAPLPTALTPVYPSTEGLPQLTLRRAIAQALDRADLSDTLPPVARERYALPLFEPAIRALHTPAQGESEQALLERVHPAWRRIKFDELLAQQLSLAAARARRVKEAAPLPPSDAPDGLVARLYETLPFKLTGAQQRVVRKSPQTWRSRIRCIACCRATWAAARPWSRPSPRPRPSRPGPRWR